MSTPEPRERYYREAASWNRDREDASRASRRIAWIAACVAALIALAEAVALVALTPLKTVQPYTLLVDRQTGYVQALDPLQPARIGADAALTQSFVVQYVIARESFDIAALQTNYRKVAAWSEGGARAAYVASVQASNPASPLASLPRSTVVETRVKSVSPVGRSTLLVRFDTQRRDEGGRVLAAQPWVAVVQYRYAGEPMALSDRFLDPLGFRVTRYQRNAEALVAEANPTPAATATATPPAEAAATPISGTRAATAAPGSAAMTPGRATPSPLLSVRQPSYVTRFPPPPTAGGAAGSGGQPFPVLRYNRRGQAIVGSTAPVRDTTP